MRSIAIYSQSNLHNDPRVHRQIESLSKHFQLIVFGKSPPKIPVRRFYDLSLLIGIPDSISRSLHCALRYLRQYGFLRFVLVGLYIIPWKYPVFSGLLNLYEVFLLRRRALSRLRSRTLEAIIANDLSALGVCATAKGKAKLIFDAHEYSPGQHAPTFVGRRKNAYARALLERYLPQCDAMMTVGEGIAELYRRNFKVEPVVITNAPKYCHLKPVFRNDGKIRLVHHGLATRRRRLESMIDVMRLLGAQFSLDFYLVIQDGRYYEELRRYAAGDERIRFNKPVPMTQLPEVLNRYDIGIRFYPPATLNVELGLPNKFFEFIQARLAVAVGPTAEAVRYIKKYGFGIVSDDFRPESMARALSAISENNIKELKEQSDLHARELSDEANSERFRSVLQSVLGDSCSDEQAFAASPQQGRPKER